MSPELAGSYATGASGNAPFMAVVVVTGASGGVGRAAARAFAERGYDVALLARGEAGLAAAAEETRGLAIPTDVADHAQVEAAAERVEQELGPIDVWVNNAMATIFSRFEDIEPDEFERSTQVTYLGAVWGTMAALRRMRPRDRGTVVQVGSALAYRGIPLQAPYCGAKHALQGFQESLRCELRAAGSDVHLTSVHLPALNTPQFGWGRAKMPRHPQPVPPIYQPEVAAKAIVWAAENRRREILVGAPTYKVVLGSKFANGFTEWYLARNAIEGQQTDMPIEAPRAGNLFEPRDDQVDGGAHGVFGDRARSRSPLLWLTTHRAQVGVAAGAALAVGAAALARLR